MTGVDDQQKTIPLSDRAPTPDKHQIAVLMQCLPVTGNPWISSRWELISVIPARSSDRGVDSEPSTEGIGHRIVRHDGLSLQLHSDESESYYHNLMVDKPRCFVVSRQADDTDPPKPVLVTASFDAANAYAEGDDRVDSAPLSATLCHALESYVLTHYVPTKRTKRKRQNWKTSS